ncbi:uncharacterized protein LOC121736511 [Aricia agestis]|uniref:uncharacterized protein LOC121736511 n=1 Tax=Aricia agestis TaxID=91739 RepID=UPI001C2090AD|nr:uncharacterized protein LOC121736511 [Aricia agestis]
MFYLRISLLLFLNLIIPHEAAVVVPRVELNDGRKMPAIALGTWLGNNAQGPIQPVGDEVEKAVTWALKAGYRHIDTAWDYKVEDQVGRGLNGVSREELFITTKLWNDAHARSAVVPALRASLDKLQLDYVDLYLIHWPTGQYENGTYDLTDYLETWRGMMEAKELGLTKSIGLSNFNQDMISRILNNGLEKPAVLEVELNLNLQQPALLSYCRSHNITVMGYTPFGALFRHKARADAPPPRVDDPQLVAVAQKYHKTVPQLVLRYLVELGVVPIPKSVTKRRIEENIDIFDFHLQDEDKELLRSYDRGYRNIPQLEWRDHPYYPFERTALVVGQDTAMFYLRISLLLSLNLIVPHEAAVVVPRVKLNDGRKMPAIALGTWLGNNAQGPIPPGKDEVEKAVTWALEAGYRHIDTAWRYKVEDQVGRGLKGVPREELFITTKLWNDAHARSAVVPALRASLDKLQLDFVDLYLIHWPSGQYENGTYDMTDYLETWRGMVEAKELGLTKSIGLSNFNQDMISRILNNSLEKPAVLQVELNLNLQQPALLSYCRSHNITVMGYTPFGALFRHKARADAPPPRVDDPQLVAVAQKYHKTVPQLVLRYLVELGVVPIPKSVTKRRIEENIDIFDFHLQDEDKELLRSYDRGYRTIPQLQWRDHPYYPFEKTAV